MNSSHQAIAKGNASIAMVTPNYWESWEYGISTKESFGSRVEKEAVYCSGRTGKTRLSKPFAVKITF